MLNPSAQKDIITFVSRFFAVKEHHIYKFFRDVGKQNVQFYLKDLLYNGYLYCYNPNGTIITLQDIDEFEENPGRIWSSSSRLRNIKLYHDLWKAIEVMAELPSGEVKEFRTEIMPHELCFLDNENIMYDVTVFNSVTWASTYTLEKRTRPVYLPKGKIDVTNHIAVVDDAALIPHIEDLGFRMFILLKGNTILKKFSY